MAPGCGIAADRDRLKGWIGYRLRCPKPQLQVFLWRPLSKLSQTALAAKKFCTKGYHLSRSLRPVFGKTIAKHVISSADFENLAFFACSRTPCSHSRLFSFARSLFSIGARSFVRPERRRYLGISFLPFACSYPPLFIDCFFPQRQTQSLLIDF